MSNKILSKIKFNSNSLDTYLIRDQLAVPVTSWEVYANDEEIPSGTLLKDIPWIITTQYNSSIQYLENPIPSGMSQAFNLRLTSSVANSDVSVDWGDGTIEYIKDGQYSKLSSTNIKGDQVIMFHTYESSGNYKIKVFGKKYFNINHAVSTYTDKNGVSHNTTVKIYNDIQILEYLPMNLTCNCCGQGLEIASHLTSTASMFCKSARLIRIQIPRYSKWIHNIKNWSDTFAGCYNLKKVAGFENAQLYTDYVQNIFASCRQMQSCDFRLPRTGVYTSAFGSCVKLTSNISTLLPKNPILQKSKEFSSVFNGCSLINGTIDDKILWNNKNIKWSSTSTAFIGCSTALRQKVPASWGGLGNNSQLIQSDDLSSNGGVISGLLDVNNINITGYIKLNNNSINQPSGLVQLDENGKIASSLLDKNYSFNSPLIENNGNVSFQSGFIDTKFGELNKVILIESIPTLSSDSGTYYTIINSINQITIIDANQNVITPTKILINTLEQKTRIQFGTTNPGTTTGWKLLIYGAHSQGSGSSTSLVNLSDLTNVNISNPTGNQVLTYNLLSEKWINQSLPSNDPIVSSLTISNSTVSLDYNTADVYNLTTGSGITSYTIIPSNITLGQAMMIRLDNTTNIATSINFKSNSLAQAKEIIKQQGIYFICITNITGTPEIIGDAIKQS